MLKEGKLNNVNNFEKEYTVMKRIEDMSKNEKLKYMFKLLPKYWGDIDEELVNAKKAVSVLGGTIEEVKKFQLPGTDIDRSLVYIKKIKPTSGKFPRKAGLPSKEPVA